MKMTAAVLRVAACAVCAACSLSGVRAQSTFVADNFTRIGPGETITAPFTASGGTSTTGTLGSLVEITVSGTGYALGPTVSDAFYFLNGSAVGQYYGLNIGFSGRPFAGGLNNNIQNWMTFIEGVGTASPGTIPAYSSANTYHFVLELPASAATGPLIFGVSDGAYTDNGGAYTVQINPVVRGITAAPEGGALVYVLPGGLLLFILRRPAPSRRKLS